MSTGQIESLKDTVVGLLVVVVIVIAVLAVFNVGRLPIVLLQDSASSGGTIEACGVELNRTSIDWGALLPNENKTVNMTVSNTYQGHPVSLSMTVDDWNPANATGYISITWNYTGEKIAPEGSMDVSLTIHISPDITGIQAFNNTITITGTA